MTENKVFYREMKSDDYPIWEKLSKQDFLPEDFCSADYLLEKENVIKGWVLLTESDDWIGCCFISFNFHEYNPDGVHFLESWIAPKYRGMGYSKYLAKIRFDVTTGLRKSCCINPKNIPSIKVALKNGFVNGGPHKTWDNYFCDKEHYPEHLKELNVFLRAE